MLKHGIRGGSKWLGEKEWLGENNIVDTAFQTESEEDTNEVIEKLRHEITAPIASFKEKTKGEKQPQNLQRHCLNILRTSTYMPD